MKQKTINILRIVILSAIFSTAIGYSFADWTPPPPCGVPPCGNPPPPINAGAAMQFKSGNFVLGNMLYAKKAETQSTLGTVGCTPGPACDSGKTLVTKDYVDGQLASNGKIFYVDGFSCATCPYGSYTFTWTPAGFTYTRQACYVKNSDGTLFNAIPQQADNLGASLNEHECAWFGDGTPVNWGFWTY